MVRFILYDFKESLDFIVKALVIHFWKVQQKRSQNFICNNLFSDTGVFYRPKQNVSDNHKNSNYLLAIVNKEMKFYTRIYNYKIQLLTKFHYHTIAKWYFTDQKRNTRSGL